MYQELLKQLGLNDKEITVYLTVLQQGKVTPADLAKLTGINRTTVYSIAKMLIQQGIITEDLGSPQRYLVALPPVDLARLVQNEERKLAEKKKIVTQAIEELQQFTKKTQYSIPKIVFIAQEQLEDYLYKRTPEWNRSSAETANTICWGFQDTSFVVHYEDWIDWSWKVGNPKNLVWRLITNQADIEQAMKKKEYERRNIKFWDASTTFTATTWVCGDYLIMIMTSQRPHYLVEIHDAVLAHNMRELFKGIWKTL